MSPSLELARTEEALLVARPRLQHRFVQSHGLVTPGKSRDEVQAIDSRATALAWKALTLQTIQLLLGTGSLIFPGVLFPDEGVAVADKSKTHVNEEAISAYDYLFKETLLLGYRPNFVPASKVLDITGVDCEKHSRVFRTEQC